MNVEKSVSNAQTDVNPVVAVVSADGKTYTVDGKTYDGAELPEFLKRYPDVEVKTIQVDEDFKAKEVKPTVH